MKQENKKIIIQNYKDYLLLEDLLESEIIWQQYHEDDNEREDYLYRVKRIFEKEVIACGVKMYRELETIIKSLKTIYYGENYNHNEDFKELFNKFYSMTLDKLIIDNRKEAQE